MKEIYQAHWNHIIPGGTFPLSFKILNMLYEWVVNQYQWRFQLHEFHFQYNSVIKSLLIYIMWFHL